MENNTDIDLILSVKHNEAINIFSLAGYVIKFGDTVFPGKDGATKTFSIWKDDKRKYGCSSTSMLTPKFAIDTIQRDSFNKGHAKGVLDTQTGIKKLLGIQ